MENTQLAKRLEKTFDAILRSKSLAIEAMCEQRGEGDAVWDSQCYLLAHNCVEVLGEIGIDPATGCFYVRLWNGPHGAPNATAQQLAELGTALALMAVPVE